MWGWKGLRPASASVLTGRIDLRKLPIEGERRAQQKYRAKYPRENTLRRGLPSLLAALNNLKHPNSDLIDRNRRDSDHLHMLG
jgi:hypothetical protein